MCFSLLEVSLGMELGEKERERSCGGDFVGRSEEADETGECGGFEDEACGRR